VRIDDENASPSRVPAGDDDEMSGWKTPNVIWDAYGAKLARRAV
jgi:hypothetical protein